MTVIGIVGLGLIGGSIAHAATQAGHEVIAWDPDTEVGRRAQAAGLEIDRDLSRASLVALAAPMPALTSGLSGTLASVRLSGSATLTDVGSLKVPVADAVEVAGLSERFIGGHPMAGTQRSGFDAAEPDLLAGSTWVLCPPSQARLDRWFEVADLVTSLGALVLPVSASEHDRAMGLVSGLPHVLALALEATLADGSDHLAALCAGSFADLTRVAGSDPTLLRAVVEDNKPSVRAALGTLVGHLDGSWDQLIVSGLDARRRRLHRPEALITTLEVRTGSDLLALGQAGARVISVHPDRLTLTVTVPQQP